MAYPAVKWSCEFASLPGQGHRTGSTASMAHCLGFRIRQNCPLSCLVWQEDRITDPTLQMGRAPGWVLLLGHHCKCSEVSHSASWVLWLCSWSGEIGLYSAIGRTMSLFPCFSFAQKRFQGQNSLLDRDQNQVEVCTEFLASVVTRGALQMDRAAG